MTDWTNEYVRWYQYHKEDYAAAKERLSANRRAMLDGDIAAASRLLRLSCLSAMLSIQTTADRHERAFIAYCAGDRSIETAFSETVFGNLKNDWWQDAQVNCDYTRAIEVLREEGHTEALCYLVDNHTGLSYVKAGFSLAMCGIWELACPDTRTIQELGLDERTRSLEQYKAKLDAIDKAVPIDEPAFLKQWVVYDVFGGEHARHMTFFREAWIGDKWL